MDVFDEQSQFSEHARVAADDWGVGLYSFPSLIMNVDWVESIPAFGWIGSELWGYGDRAVQYTSKMFS